MSLKYDVDFSMGKIDNLLKSLEVDITKSVGKGVSQGLENSEKNATKRGAAIGANLKKGITGSVGDLGLGNATTNAGLQATGSATNAGKRIGEAISFAALGAMTTNLGRGIINTVSGVVTRSYTGAIDRLKSEVALDQTIAINESRDAAARKKLANPNTTIEGKAIALGIDTKVLYKNAKASSTAANAGKGLEQSINAQKRALEDVVFSKEQNINILDKQVKKIREETQARINLTRTMRGADPLEDSNKKLEAQIDSLKLQENELETNGLSTAAIKLQIEELERKRETNDLLLNQIERETDAIEEQGRTLEDELLEKIERIKQEIADANNKFEIDTRDATNKLQELKDLASSVSVGGGGEQKVLDPEAVKFVEAQAQAKLNTKTTVFSQEDIAKVKTELLNRFGRTLSETGVNQLLGDLILTNGIESENTDQLTRVASQLIESASVLKSDNISLETAAANLGFAVRTGQSQIGNQSGLPENFATEIDPLGLSLLEERLITEGKLEDAARIRAGFYTEEEKMQGRILGVLNRTDDTVGSYTRLLDEGALAGEEAALAWNEMYIALGVSILPLATDFLEIVNKIVSAITTFVAENPQLVQFLLIFASIIGVILTIVGFVISAVVVIGLFVTAVSAIAAALAVPFSVVLLIIAAVIAVIILIVAYIAALYVVFTKLYQENPFFTEVVDWFYGKLWAAISDWVELFKRLFSGDLAGAWEKFKEIAIKTFDTIKEVWDVVIGKITAILTDPQNWYKAWSVVSNAFQSVFSALPEWLRNFLGGIDWVSLFTGLSSALANILSSSFKTVSIAMIESIGGDNPIAQGIINSISNIPQFASGGAFMVPQQFRNQGMPIMVHSGERVDITPESQVNNTTNIYGLTPHREFVANAFL